MLKIDFFFVSYVWLFIKRVDISLPLKMIRRMWQEVLQHEMIKLVLRTYSDVFDQVFSGR